MGKIILTGDRPTGKSDNPEKIRQNIIEVALDYLSCGLTPEKCTLYIQSQIPELAELTVYLMNLISVSRVQRNPTVKTEIKMRNFEANIPLGFFCYPVSQAADITAFKATTVPAGEDQEPMIEVTRELVRRFNQIYSPVLVEPNIMLPENATARRLPGTDGKEKMSKSLGNCIYLSDDKDTLWQKVRSMYTDPTHVNVSDPGHVEGNAVFTYLEAFSTDQDFADFWPEYKISTAFWNPSASAGMNWNKIFLPSTTSSAKDLSRRGNTPHRPWMR